jgi:very-short-patch-repair endonuclease
MPDAFVKHLRHNQTRAESRLWFQLRRKRIAGRAFRRQHRLDRYIVDFVCLSARLVIEVDGPSHDFTLTEDTQRTRRLEAQGYRVLRFSNAQILTDLDSVVRTVEAVLLNQIPIHPAELIPRPLWAGERGRGPAPAGASELFRALRAQNPSPNPRPQGAGEFLDSNQKLYYG